MKCLRTRSFWGWQMFLSAAIFAASCKSENKAPQGDKPPSGPVDELGLPPGDTPVARVNSIVIPRAPLAREMKATMERFQKAKHQVRPALRERLKDNIVHRLVDAELIRQQAQKAGVTLNEEEVAQRWKEHRARYGDEVALKTFLEKAGTTEEEIKAQFKENLLREKVFATVSDKVTLTDEQLRAFYEQNKDRYDEPEKVRASHILLRVPTEATADAKKKLSEKAKELAAKAKKGADFAELAKANSQDVTKSAGGDLGWFPRGRMVKAFEDAAFSLKDNEVSDVIETQFGFHVIKRTGYKAATSQSFEDLRPRLERQMLARERNEAIRNALKRWQDEAAVEIFIQGDPAIIAQDKTAVPGATGAPSGIATKLEVQPMDSPTTTDQPVAPPAN